MAKETIFDKMNAYYKEKTPFFFIISFDATKGEVVPLANIDKHTILFKTASHAPFRASQPLGKKLQWQVVPIAKSAYEQQFAAVMQEIKKGNSYLLNLTCEAEVYTNYSLAEIFHYTDARYKLLYKDEFVHFSPEPFIKIKGDNISAYPMKGTADAASSNAQEAILNDEKELHEQYTIVDLMRNDLSMVAKNVAVKKFRYVENIHTNAKKLFAVSSEISGRLRSNYLAAPGDVFQKLLPAGSICGAPKQKTLEIIASIETHYRNYYTGVWGIYDGESIDSCVIIRYLEKRGDKFFYKSGGGITAESDCEKEYREIKDKIYVALH